ncbi:MAG TPA: hypothetical protein VN040_04010 [Pseudosphingobacterium sp.]|nr:hypothetical protein [Pseudosphingobacterium sp.]
MISTLGILQEAIEKVICAKDGNALQEAAEEIVQVCDSIQIEAVLAYRKYKNATAAQLAFQQYHRKLVRLQAVAYSLLKLHNNASTKLIINKINALLEEHEIIYFDHLDLATSLPVHYQDQLAEQVHSALPDISARLLDKGILHCYVSELAYAMDSLFTHDKLPTICYHHRYYVPQLLNALKQLAFDKRQKSWLHRFIELLINYNFNYMGIFNRWREQQDQHLQQAILQEKGGEYFRLSKQALRHYCPPSQMAFDPQQSSLLKHMKDYINAQKRDYKQSQLEAELAHPTALQTNLSSLEMAVDFHYKYKSGYYPYATKREAAKAYAQAHRSKTGQYISPHTLEKLDKKELEAAATKMRSKLLKIAQQVKDDFNL